MKTERQTYRLYTYDVWGNRKDGYEVNDVFPAGEITLNVKGKTYNKGTAQEFTSYEPTDLQLSRAVGVRGVEWEGEGEFALYAERKTDGKPVCELRRVAD